jgi:hypothetical protein
LEIAMKARVIMLILTAAGSAVPLACRKSPPAPAPARLLQNLSLDCEETDGPADLSIRLEVDPAPNKNYLHYTITEANGFFVETFNVTFFYKPTPETTAEDSPYSFEQFLNQYVPANGTLTGCIEVVPTLFARVGGQIGTSENWGAEVIGYHRACTGNPDPMPAQRVMQCGD